MIIFYYTLVVCATTINILYVVHQTAWTGTTNSKTKGKLKCYAVCSFGTGSTYENDPLAIAQKLNKKMAIIWTTLAQYPYVIGIQILAINALTKCVLLPADQ